MVTTHSTTNVLEAPPALTYRERVLARLTIVHAQRFWTKVHLCPHGEGCAACCWEWQGAQGRRGYGKYTITSHGRSLSLVSSRVAYVLAGGDIPADRFICHACDNPPCCNPAHLWGGTARDNTQDSLSKDRWATGERHWTIQQPGRQRGELNGRAKLTERQVYEIRALQGHLTQTAIARAFGIRKGLVEKIHQRTLWAHLPAQPGDQPGVRAREVPILRGEKHPLAQLIAAQVQAIRTLHGTMTAAAIGARFGVAASTITHILRRDTWTHLPNPTHKTDD